MPFFARASGFTNQDCHMYEVAGDYVNIHLVMPVMPIFKAATVERMRTALSWFGI